MSDFKVSVVIPVYNRSRFLSHAVDSVLGIPEVGEIIIVNDGSTDDSLKVAEALRGEYSMIKVVQHKNGENRGVSASRNLGIKKSTMPFIAFLDSDDWYLKNRFIMDRKIFSKFPQADAVFSPTILEENENDYSKINGLGYDLRKKIGFNINPYRFYKESLKTKSTLFHTNSITFKKEFLLEDKLFDERLKLHEDSELWKRLLRRGNFFAGEIHSPVAVIRRHANNVITTRNYKSELKFIAVFIDNVGLENLFSFEKDTLFKRALRKSSSKHKDNWKRRIYFYLHLLKYSLSKEKYLFMIRKKYLN